jgi:hypothetical protein
MVFYWWFELTLTLLMARVRANDAEDILPLDDTACYTLPLDGCSNFHESVSVDEIG